MTRPTITEYPGKTCPTYGLLQDPTIVQQLIDMINEHAGALDSISTSITGIVVDLRSLGVVANDATAAASNTAIINTAIATYSGTRTRLMAPMGVIYLDQANPGQSAANRAWSIRFPPNSSLLSLTGYGSNATKFIQTGAGNSGQWDGIVIDGASDITLSGFAIEQGVITNRDPSDHHALIGVYAQHSVNAKDVSIHDLYFGPCIGDGLRVLATGIDGTYVDTLEMTGFIMRTGGHSQGAGGLGLGSRSGISFQRGFKNVVIGDGYIDGAKNSPIDMEPTATGAMEELLIHDVVVNNALGQTWNAVAFSGLSAANPLKRSMLHNVVILEGGLLIQNVLDCTLDAVTVYCSGGGPMATVGQGDQALIQLNTSASGITLHATRIIRDTGSLAGPLFTSISGSSSISDITVDGGEWRSELGAGSGLVYADFQANVRPIIRNVKMRLNAAGGSEFAVKFRSNGFDVDTPVVSGVSLFASSKVSAGVYLAATNSHAISNISVTNCKMANSVTTGVLFDLNGGTSIDTTPIVQGNDFTGATDGWKAQNSAANTVFPIIAGNRGGVCTIAGTVAVGSMTLSLLQGSTYIYQNGNSSAVAFNTTGATTWTALTIP